MKYFVFACLFLCFLFNTVLAEEITVVTEEWPPYNYTQDGEITGLSTEIVNAALKKAGIKAEMRTYPWARAYKIALEQENILIYTIVRSPEREDLFKWIGPIAPRSREILYKLKKRTDIVITSLEDVKQYKTGVWRDDITHKYLLTQGFEEGTHLNVATDNKQNIGMLFRGRIDLVTESEFSLPSQLKALDLPRNELEEAFVLLEGDEEFYMAFSRQTSDQIVERVRTAFEQLKEEGSVDAIVKKYLNNSTK